MLIYHLNQDGLNIQNNMGRLLLIIGGIVFMCYITIGVFYVAEISWIDTSFFVKDHFWLWSLIVCGALALLFFYASGKSFKDVKINEAFFSQAMTDSKISFNTSKNTLTINKEDNSMALINKDGGDIVEFDLSKLTMSALTRKMAFEMTKPGPVFFKGWSNRRLELDVQRVQIIQQYIESIRSTGDSLMELQADAFLSYEKIKLLTEEKRYQLKKRVVDSKIALDFAKEEYTHRIEMMRLERENIKEDILMKKALREKTQTESLVLKMRAEAEYKLMIARGLKERQIALIMAEAVKYFNELPNVLKSYVTVQLGNEHADNPSADMEIQDRIKDFIIRKQEAEAKNLEYEAEENEAKKDTLKAKLELERVKYKKHG